MAEAESSRLPRIVHEDESLLAVWKPHRLHCAAHGGGADPSLASWVYEARPETSPAAFASAGGRWAEEGGLMHRLDFETAGLVLFAKNPPAARALLEFQEAGELRKTYRLAATPKGEGLPGSTPRRGSPAGLESEAWIEALAAGRPGRALTGRSIRSRFRAFGPRGARVACLEEARGPASRRGAPERLYETGILEARDGEGRLEAKVLLLRGFRHQIRAHFAWLGLPLLGDGLYGGAAAAELGLAAVALEFPHPRGGAPILLGEGGLGELPAAIASSLTLA